MKNKNINLILKFNYKILKFLMTWILMLWIVWVWYANWDTEYDAWSHYTAGGSPSTVINDNTWKLANFLEEVPEIEIDENIINERNELTDLTDISFDESEELSWLNNFTSFNLDDFSFDDFDFDSFTAEIDSIEQEISFINIDELMSWDDIIDEVLVNDLIQVIDTTVNEVYLEIKDLILFKDSSWNIKDESAVEAEINREMSKIDFEQYDLTDNDLELVKEWIRWRVLEDLKNEKEEDVITDYLNDYNVNDVNDVELEKLEWYDKKIYDRIIVNKLIDKYVEKTIISSNWINSVVYIVNLWTSIDNFILELKISSSRTAFIWYIEWLWLSSLEENLWDYLIELKKSNENISLLLSSNTWSVADVLSDQNDRILEYANVDNISGNDSSEKMTDAENKLWLLRQQYDYLLEQEDSMSKLWYIEWCEPWKSIDKDWIKYSWPDWKHPCSIRLFKEKVQEERISVIDWLFSLIWEYKVNKDLYTNNAKITSEENWNMYVNWDWFSECIAWSVDLWNWCSDLWKIKIKWVSYWSDAWAVILDPFWCSDKETQEEVDECRITNNWLRLEAENWKIQLKWIVYSPEVWPIKFWDISHDMDAWFETIE